MDAFLPTKLFTSLFPSPSSEEYRCSYEPLRINQIRLLTIEPGVEAAPIRCLLQIESLKRKDLQFTALSWTWGPVVDTPCLIFVNGERHSIRQSLFDALLALRLKDKSHTLWIDAICINQKDSNEKSVQIPLMSDIYTAAVSVMVWLGKAGDDSDYIFESIRNNTVEEFKTYRFWLGIRKIALRNWFSRAWVMQEFSLNKHEPLLVCGSAPALPSSSFLNALQDAANYSKDDKSPSSIKQIDGVDDHVIEGRFMDSVEYNHRLRLPDRFKRLRAVIQTYGGVDFRDTLTAFRSLQTTDPRDRLYAILGLLEPSSRDAFIENFGIDYSKSVIEVYKDAATFILTFGDHLALLIYQDFKVKTISNHSLPSWVPDFSAPYKMGKFILQHEQKFQPPTISKDGQILTTKGIALDQIKGVVEFGETLEDIINRDFFPMTMQPLRLFYTLMVSSSTRSWASADYMVKLQMRGFQYILGFMANLHKVSLLVDEFSGNLPLVEPLWKTIIGNGMAFHQSRLPDDGECERRFSLFISRGSRLSNDADDAVGDPLYIALEASIGGRTFFVGSRRWYGVAQGKLRLGDRLVLLFPPQYVPFIIRPAGDHYEIVGVAYLSPAMTGEALSSAENEVEDFSFV